MGIKPLNTNKAQKDLRKAKKIDPVFYLKDNMAFIGIQSFWEQELSELKGIVNYLIEKTNDVEAFYKEAPRNGDHATAMSLAVESDFDEICRFLIVKGAKPARIFVNGGIPYDSYVFRAAWFKSWKTLKMLLTDLKDKIKPIINERYREEKWTAATGHTIITVNILVATQARYGSYITVTLHCLAK